MKNCTCSICKILNKNEVVKKASSECCEEVGCEEKLDKIGDNQQKIQIPIEVQESSGGTRVIIDMSKIAEILEKLYDGVPKKTEIQMGERNEVIFDLELKS